MPACFRLQLILDATFGGLESVEKMKAFMLEWQQAEEAVTSAELAVLEDLDPRDRGPFFYWLLNERLLLNVAPFRFKIYAISTACNLLRALQSELHSNDVLRRAAVCVC
jgi:hypothetical protein